MRRDTWTPVSDLRTVVTARATEKLLLGLVRASRSTVGDYRVHRLAREHLKALGYEPGLGKRSWS